MRDRGGVRKRPNPLPVVAGAFHAYDAAVAFGRGSNAAARCKSPACVACSSLACAAQVPQMPQAMQASDCGKFRSYRNCLAVQSARTKVPTTCSRSLRSFQFLCESARCVSVIIQLCGTSCELKGASELNSFQHICTEMRMVERMCRSIVCEIVRQLATAMQLLEQVHLTLFCARLRLAFDICL